jgi:hypothetical protein
MKTEMADGRNYGPEINAPQVSLPPETEKTIRDNFPGDIQTWVLSHLYPYPALAVPKMHLPEVEISRNQTDIYQIMSQFFETPELKGSLRVADLSTGCDNCSTCYMDSPPESSRMTAVSWEKLVNEPKFLEILSPDHFRFGSAGDILNHPDGVSMVRSLLTATEPLHAKLRKDNKSYYLKFVVNYRPNRETQLTELLEMCLDNPVRTEITVSLPRNRNPNTLNAFTGYMVKNSRFFPDPLWQENFYMGQIDGATEKIRAVKIKVPDVIGRVLAEDTDRHHRFGKYYQTGIKPYDFAQRGLTSILLNSDGLWQIIYATSFDSRTTKIFIPLTPVNIPWLSRLPWHGDFPKPPNWRGEHIKPEDPFVAAWGMPDVDRMDGMKPLHIV